MDAYGFEIKVIMVAAGVAAVAAVIAASKLERIQQMIEERLIQEARAQRRFGNDPDIDEL